MLKSWRTKYFIVFRCILYRSYASPSKYIEFNFLPLKIRAIKTRGVSTSEYYRVAVLIFKNSLDSN